MIIILTLLGLLVGGLIGMSTSNQIWLDDDARLSSTHIASPMLAIAEDYIPALNHRNGHGCFDSIPH
jgi:hypothetical protein